MDQGRFIRIFFSDKTLKIENHTSEFSDWVKVKTIFDKYGKEYHVILRDNEFDPVFKVLIADDKIQESEVGYANCLYEEDRILKLADIHMFERAVLAYRRSGLFGRFQKVKRETKNFQHCGLGSKLLECIFAFAKDKGIRRIIGKVKAKDYPKNPNLLKWYANMGFTVTMENKTSALVAKISKEL